MATVTNRGTSQTPSKL